MSLLLSAGRLMAAGLPAQVAQLFTNLLGSGLSFSLGAGEFFYESASDTITAYGAGGQTNATALTSEMSRITTATGTTTFSSVALPPSAAGLTIFVENAAANPVQVFGAGTDTINGIATATGVAQMPSSVVVYTCYTAGSWFAANLGTGYFGSFETSSAQTSLTAHAGGGQGSALQITAMVAQFSTVATTGDSAVLPLATGLPTGAALTISVVNTGANSMNVFCPVGGTMNGVSNGSAAVSNTVPTIFFATSPSAWFSK